MRGVLERRSVRREAALKSAPDLLRRWVFLPSGFCSLLESLPRASGGSGRRGKAFVALVFLVALSSSQLFTPALALAEGKPLRATKPVLVDRAVVRFSAPEGGGRERPYFIYERELAFEARLVALADAAHRSKKEPYRRHHLQQALERHVAETLLAALSIDPPPTEEEISLQIESARSMVVSEVGGEAPFLAAASAEGIGALELRSYLRRRALASLYLHVMVTPMLTPSPLELRRVHRDGEGPLSDLPFEDAEPALRRWYVARSLRTAVETYFQNARARVRLAYL